MKKMKKLFAILMTMAMVMGLSITGFAEPKKPEASDAATGTVANVEATAIVTAYQIVEATYNTSGFTGYKVVDAVSDSNTKIADKHNPTPAELTAIAKNETLLDSLKEVSMTAGQVADGFCDFTGQLNAGYWLVLVTGDSDHDIKEVYNPMLLGIYYTGTGSNGELTTNPDKLDANSSWTIDGSVVYAKSSSVPITKTANVETADLGDAIEFTIDTTVPYYSDEYDTETLQFAVSDTLTNLALLVDSTHTFKVEKETTSNVYETIDSSKFNYGVDENESPNQAPVTGDTSFEVSFDSTWIKQNGGANIRITYYATLTDGALNTIPGSNDATVTYTNDPSETTDSNKDTEKVYTFDIDGDVTADILKKVKPGTLEGSTEELNGAEFTLYTNSACTDEYIYKNSKGEGKATSDSSGKIAFTGLAADTYYLKETAAPNGYTLNDTVYEIKITANIQNEELVSWSYEVKPYGSSDDNVATSTFKVSGGTVTPAEENTTTEIMNTTLTELPSTGGMGTTLFTIAGCVIMISAAGLFFATRKKAN